MRKNILANAVSVACMGATLSVASISTASADATTMYNLYQENGGVACAPCSGSATDGWVYGFGSAPTPDTAVEWAGTADSRAPFGYSGGGALHWGIGFDGFGGAEISNADSLARYGKSADIDTAKGAWSDANRGDASGWRHSLEYGVVKSNVRGRVVVTVMGVNEPGTNFGFTVFKGMDTSTTAYGHHGSWNGGNNVDGITTNSLPKGGTTFTVDDVVAYTSGGATASNLNTISFLADADQEYTIVLGGYKNGKWNETTDGYIAMVSHKLDFNVEVTDLIGQVEALNSSKGTNGLIAKLEEALNATNITVKANKLQDFIDGVEAKRGKGLSESDADALVATARFILDNEVNWFI